MRQIHAPATIKDIEALHYVVWLARPDDFAQSRSTASALPPSDQSRHCPEPCLRRALKRLGAWQGARSRGGELGEVTAGESNHEGFPILGRATVDAVG